MFANLIFAVETISSVNSSFATAFKAPPWAVAGSPAVNRTNVVKSPYWADVELSKIGNQVTLSINKTPILQFTNSTYNSGNIMLGYEDAFDSIGDAQANFVFYDNLRVISLAAPTITSIELLGADVKITYTAGTADVTGQFGLQTASEASGPYTDTSSTMQSLGGGVFTSTVAYNPLDANRYYRIRRLY